VHIIPTDQDSAEQVHPSWCDRQHTGPVHTADVGGQDIELSDETLHVSLFQLGDEPVQVWLCQHAGDNTLVIPMPVEQAAELGRRLLEAATTEVTL
jgi:hypothetical protein